MMTAVPSIRKLYTNLVYFSEPRSCLLSLHEQRVIFHFITVLSRIKNTIRICKLFFVWLVIVIALFCLLSLSSLFLSVFLSALFFFLFPSNNVVLCSP